MDRRVWISLASVSVAACGAGSVDSAESADLRITFDTMAGVVHVRNEGPPPEWSLRELVTLGSAGGSTQSPDEFGRIAGIVADSAGFIYVADAIATEIRVFDQEGRFVRRIGREGGGPGEFGSLQSVGWLGDRLAVLDPGNGRIGLLSSEGEWLGQRPYTALTGTGVRIYPTGPEEIYTPFFRARNNAGEMVFVRQTIEGPADTLPNPPAEETQSVRVLCTHSGGQGISSYGASFAPRRLRVPAPGVTRAEASTADYRIALTTADGDTARIIDRDVPSLTVSDAAWQEEEAAFQEFLDRFADESCQPSRLPRPDAMEMLRAIVFDRDGRMWVERRIAEGGYTLDAFDAKGRLLGTVPIPDRLERVPPYVRDGRLYLVVTDEFDVEYVKVFEVSEKLETI